MSDAGAAGNSRGARERILAAATELAGREGLEALTTRRVAQEAGVNVGLLHYYFESKEALVEETLAGFLAEMLSIAESGGMRTFAAAEDGDREGAGALSEEELCLLLGKALELASRRPGLLFGLIEKLVETVRKMAGRKAAGEEPLELPKASPLGILAMVETVLYGRIRPLLVESLGEEPELVGRRALQLIASIFHPMLFTPFPSTIFGVDLGSEVQKRDYVRKVIRDALSPPS